MIKIYLQVEEDVREVLSISSLLELIRNKVYELREMQAKLLKEAEKLKNSEEQLNSFVNSEKQSTVQESISLN